MNSKYVHLSKRLETALQLIAGSETVADIGCDHGRLTAALIQRRACNRVIASDISCASLQKAKDLIAHIGINDAVSFRVGNGLSVLSNHECDTIAMLGMGGTLMTRILDAETVPLKGAKAAVFQPMRAQGEIRKYLYNHNYLITDDVIIQEHGRFYQIIRAVPASAKQETPVGWPYGFFDIGFVSFTSGEQLLADLVEDQLRQASRQSISALGTLGEHVLNRKIQSLHKILDLLRKG